MTSQFAKECGEARETEAWKMRARSAYTLNLAMGHQDQRLFFADQNAYRAARANYKALDAEVKIARSQAAKAPKSKTMTPSEVEQERQQVEAMAAGAEKEAATKKLAAAEHHIALIGAEKATRTACAKSLLLLEKTKKAYDARLAPHKQLEGEYRAALEAHERIHGKDSDAGIAVHAKLGQLLWGLREFEVALKEYKGLIEKVRGRADYGGDHPMYLAYRSEMGSILLQAGRNEEAKEVLLKVLEVQDRVLGPEDLETLTTRNALIQAYDRLNDQSKRYFVNKKCLEILRPKPPVVDSEASVITDILADEAPTEPILDSSPQQEQEQDEGKVSTSSVVVTVDDASPARQPTPPAGPAGAALSPRVLFTK